MARVSNIESLYPPFGEQVERFLEKIKERGLPAHVFETYRSFERQEKLYSQGREKSKGIWVITNKSKIVTKALPGKSWHAYGIAVDFAFDGNLHKRGVQWSWNDADVTKPGKQSLPWNELGELGVGCGLEWAGNWKRFKEFPHFQNKYGLVRNRLYEILISDGLEMDKKIKPKKNIVSVVEDVIEKPLENLIEKLEDKPFKDQEKKDNTSSNDNNSTFKIILDSLVGLLRIFSSTKRNKK